MHIACLSIHIYVCFGLIIAQIAFAVDDKEAKLAPEFVHKRRFGKTEYSLYVHSYLNYGLNSARQLMLKGDANSDGVCLPPEYSGNWQDLTLVAKEVCVGMGWDGMGWDGMGWDGMGSMQPACILLEFFMIGCVFSARRARRPRIGQYCLPNC
jgi:hypothetical protein